MGKNPPKKAPLPAGCLLSSTNWKRVQWAKCHRKFWIYTPTKYMAFSAQEYRQMRKLLSKKDVVYIKEEVEKGTKYKEIAFKVGAPWAMVYAMFSEKGQPDEMRKLKSGRSQRGDLVRLN